LNGTFHWYPGIDFFSVESCKLKVPARATVTPKVEEHLVARTLEADQLENVKTHNLGRNREAENTGT